MAKKTRRNIDAALKAKIAIGGVASRLHAIGPCQTVVGRLSPAQSASCRSSGPRRRLPVGKWLRRPFVHWRSAVGPRVPARLVWISGSSRGRKQTTRVTLLVIRRFVSRSHRQQRPEARVEGERITGMCMVVPSIPPSRRAEAVLYP